MAPPFTGSWTSGFPTGTSAGGGWSSHNRPDVARFTGVAHFSKKQNIADYLLHLSD